MMTTGFRDAFRLAGGPRTTEIDDHLQLNVPDIVDRRAIAEIDERIDWSGTVLVPLDLDQVRAQAKRLVEEQQVDALAVCFLWSHANGEHELAAEAAIKELYPDLFVTPSHRVFPVEGETRRWTTAILNSFVQDRADVYLTSLNEKLRTSGLKGGLAFFQGLGGGISLEKARAYPLGLLGSGPAGGAIGANELAKRMGKKRVLLGDMGGTSFDTGIIVDNEIHIDKNLELGPFMTGVNLVDVVSVGAGGGSIGWVSERGVPQRRPAQRGLDPGPGGARPRRRAADGHRRDGDARLHRPRQLPRRPRAAQARALARGARLGLRRALRLVARRSRPRRCTTSSSSTWPTPCARSASARAMTRASSSSSPTAARCRCSPRRSPSGSGSRRS